mgnify:FL=1
MMAVKNYVYIVRCRDGSFYTGWTTDIEHRLAMHDSGKGAKYTRGRGPVELVHLEEFDTKNDALSRESAIKKMSREKKLELIGGK